MWIDLDTITKNKIGISNIINKLKTYEVKTLPKYIGFIDYFDKSKIFDLKVKDTDLTNKNNKGAFFINKIPQKMKDVLKNLLDENKKDKINEKTHPLFVNHVMKSPPIYNAKKLLNTQSEDALKNCCRT